jgi:hypothetical protein
VSKGSGGAFIAARGAADSRLTVGMGLSECAGVYVRNRGGTGRYGAVRECWV